MDAIPAERGALDKRQLQVFLLLAVAAMQGLPAGSAKVCSHCPVLNSALGLLLAFAIVVPTLGLGLHEFLSIVWALFFSISFFFFPFPLLWASLVAWLVKNPPAVRGSWVQSLGWEDPLEKGKTAQSSILAWRIPWTV